MSRQPTHPTPSLPPRNSWSISTRRSAKDGKDRRHTLVTGLTGRMSILIVMLLKQGAAHWSADNFLYTVQIPTIHNDTKWGHLSPRVAVIRRRRARAPLHRTRRLQHRSSRLEAVGIKKEEGLCSYRLRDIAAADLG